MAPSVVQYVLYIYYRCVDVTGAYSAQKTELNISLTAVGLLWTMTDFIAKGLLNGPFEEKETGSYSVVKPSVFNLSMF